MLTFHLVEKPDGHGADDYEPDEGLAYTIEARLGDTYVGYLAINVLDEDDELHVRWIQIEEPYRLRGFGKQLILEAARRWPNYQFTTNGFTDDGEPFWDRVVIEGELA